MYYALGEEGIQKVKKREWESLEGGVGIFDEESFLSEFYLKEDHSIHQNPGAVFFCRLEHHANYLFCTFHIPVKKKEKRQYVFSLYLLPGKLIFVDEGEVVMPALEKNGGRENHIPRTNFCRNSSCLLLRRTLYMWRN